MQRIVGSDEWANDSIWPGYWSSMADFPISYDYMILKLLHYGDSQRGSDPCPNSPKENIMFIFHPYSSRTCRLRLGSVFFNISTGRGAKLFENDPYSRPYDVLNNMTSTCSKAYAFCKSKNNRTIITTDRVEFNQREKACIHLNATFCKCCFKLNP